MPAQEWREAERADRQRYSQPGRLRGSQPENIFGAGEYLYALATLLLFRLQGGLRDGACCSFMQVRPPVRSKLLQERATSC